jgi:hypothetical protein
LAAGLIAGIVAVGGLTAYLALTPKTGEKAGVIGVTAVYALLHIGWLSMLDVIFVFAIGLFFGFLTLKTGSIIGVSLSHGITNVLLFLAMPSLA